MNLALQLIKKEKKARTGILNLGNCGLTGVIKRIKNHRTRSTTKRFSQRFRECFDTRHDTICPIGITSK